jgi:hypothetical protein
VYDLKVKLLRNETDCGFVTSDNPVVRHNQYYEGNDYFGQTGWAQVGLQVFLPVSPKCLYLFYDGATYGVGAKSSSVVSVTSVKDVEALNALQWLNALENVYFAPGTEQAVVPQAAHITPRRRKDKTSVSEHRLSNGRIKDNPPDAQCSLLHEFRPGLPVRLKAACIRLRRRPKHPRFDDRAAPVRDDKYLRIVEDFDALLIQKKVRPDEFLSFAAKHPSAQNKRAG